MIVLNYSFGLIKASLYSALINLVDPQAAGGLRHGPRHVHHPLLRLLLRSPLRVRRHQLHRLVREAEKDQAILSHRNTLPCNPSLYLFFPPVPINIANNLQNRGGGGEEAAAAGQERGQGGSQTRRQPGAHCRRDRLCRYHSQPSSGYGLQSND